MSKVALITEQLGEYLLEKINNATSVCILTSFVMKSGVRLLKDALRNAAVKGADIKICTGDYLFITQPDALAELLGIHKNIEVRLFKSEGSSFHPKAYLFEENDKESFFVGSSNLSASALTDGTEWNVEISENRDVYELALDEFLKLFYHKQTVSLNLETLKSYRKEYDLFHQKNPNLVEKWTKAEEIELMLPVQKSKTKEDILVKETSLEYDFIKPRFAQIEALEELENVLELGYNKSMVVMATGLGKTYLAAFFAKRFKKVLFVAHREEILRQARDSFTKVIPDKTFAIYDGHVKENGDFVFGSVFTLSMKQHIQRFKPDQFDLIVIDEFHHAASQSYQRLLHYFHPQFLLGITATPDRSDHKDVYALCDGNIAYKMHFLEAVQRKWLAPFTYYGIYDETDYSQVRWLGTHYDEDQLFQQQMESNMAETILNAWKTYKKLRTLVFCSSIRQADFLSSYFNEYGYKTVSLHSRQRNISRKNAIMGLENDSIDAIFTVDLFNEGVDIPSVDTLLFVRPTESLTVFTQQIGRGLRLYPNKDKCIIIDLIGNYRNADIKLQIFDLQKNEKKSKKAIMEPTVPESCELNLDVKVINLLEEMTKKRQPRKEQLQQSYIQLTEVLGHRPTYLELHLKGSLDAKQYYHEFKSYHAFLYWADELSVAEKVVYDRYEKWLKEVESTGMSKSYKMIVLLAMLNRGSDVWFKPITPEKVAPFFHEYLISKGYRKQIDFSDKGSQRLWVYDRSKVAALISSMPMTKWSGSSKGLVKFENGSFNLEFDILPEDQQTIYEWTKEICEYRLHSHFERKAKSQT